MKILVAVVLLVILFGGFILTQSQNRSSQSSQIVSPTPLVQNEAVDIKASFTIITNGVTRSFTASMYHNLSPDVYIEASDPSIVHVKRRGITWNDFFKTLPIKLTKECLTTGTKETFCTGKNGTLRFYLNEVEEKNLLDREIKEGDRVRIEFR